jgi:hypothetical protein
VLKGPPGGMPSYRRREIRQFPKSLSIWSFWYRWSDPPSLGSHLAQRSILLSADTLIQTGSCPLWPTSEINRALSLPRLAVVARKFQVGDDADRESTRMAPSANGSFSFQPNLAGGE